MSFTYAYQPELIRASQKDSEMIQQIYQNICNLLEYFVSTRQIYNKLNIIKMLSNLTYYLLTYFREVKTIGEEYTNIQVFNYSDYDDHFVQYQKQIRKVLFIILQLLSFSISKLRSRQIMYQQQNQTNKMLKNLPDINDVLDGIQEFHLAVFLIQGSYFEISKRLTQIQFIFNRVPPNHNIKYKRIGQAYLILLSLQFIKYLYNFILKIKNENMKDQINKERNITTNENNDKLTQCLICYDNATNITCTPCGHLYCWDCIMQQINLKQQCPICRQDCQVQQLIQFIDSSAKNWLIHQVNSKKKTQIEINQSILLYYYLIEFQLIKLKITQDNQIIPRYLKLNLWQEEKENKIEVENGIQQLCSFDQQMLKDPQFISLYNQEIFTYLLTQEEKYLVSNNYMNEQQQPDLNARMRAILLDWLIDVHLKFKLRDETLYVTTYLIDRFLNFKTTTRQQLQLVGVASLFIACKYEEIYPPDLKDFVYITDNAYTKQDVLDMEGQILQTLDFSITQPSSYCFLQRFGRIAGLDTKNLYLAQYLLELSMIDIKFMNYKPSFLCAAAIYLVHKIRKTPQSWNEEMQKMTGYNEQELRYCAKEMCLVLQSSDKSNLQAVRKKFAQPKYLEVSRIRVERQIKQQK